MPLAKRRVSLVALGVLLAAALWTPGCASHTERISKAAGKASQEAGEVIRHAQEAQAMLADPPAEVPATPDTLAWLGAINSHLLAIASKASTIRASATAIQSAVPHVEDKVPWWARLLRMGLIVAAIVGVGWLLWQTKLGMLIAGFVWGLGLLIPKRARTAAKFDHEQLTAAPDDNNRREAIAAKRGSDPAYDAAYRKIHTEAKLKGTV